MAKTTRIDVVSGCIHYGAAMYLPGETFDCDSKEAKRLKDLGVACDPTGKEQEQQPDQEATQQRLELLSAIASAETPEALAALMPETEPDEEIKIAFTIRMGELEK